VRLEGLGQLKESQPITLPNDVGEVDTEIIKKYVKLKREINVTEEEMV
jgi:hypothetical protein